MRMMSARGTVQELSEKTSRRSSFGRAAPVGSRRLFFKRER